MAQVVLQRAGIVAVIRQLEAAGVAQHVRMDGKWQLGGYAEALDELMERRIQIETSAENCGGFSFFSIC